MGLLDGLDPDPDEGGVVWTPFVPASTQGARGDDAATSWITWSRLLPWGSGEGAVLFYDQGPFPGTAIFARPVSVEPDSAGWTAALELGSATQLSGVVRAMDVARVGTSAVADHYAVTWRSSLDDDLPVLGVTLISVSAEGGVSTLGTTTFPGRHIPDIYKSAEAKLAGDGAIGPVLMARRADVDGGMAVQRITLAGGSLSFGGVHSLQMEEEWVEDIPYTGGLTYHISYFFPRDLALLAVADDYALVVKGPRDSITTDSDFWRPPFGDTPPAPYAIDVGWIGGTTGFEVLDSHTGVSFGEAALVGDAVPYQFAGGGTVGDGFEHRGPGSLFSGNAETRQHQQFWSARPGTGDIIYFNRLTSDGPASGSSFTDSNRELLSLQLRPGAVILGQERYRFDQGTFEPAARDNVPLVTSRGVMLFRSGISNFTNESNQVSLVWDALGMDPLLVTYFGRPFRNESGGIEPSILRTGVEGMVEAPGCLLVLCQGTEWAYVGMVRGSVIFAPEGALKDVGRHFITP